MLRHLQWSASKEKLVCKLRVLFMKIKNISLAKMTSIFAIAFLVCAHAHALTISGTLTSGGKPLRGIIILGSGGISDASTDKLGKYSLSVPAAGTYTITPYLRSGNYTFSALSKDVTVSTKDVAGIDFQAIKLTTTSVITGYALSVKGEILTNVPVHINKLGTVTSDKNGVYTFSNVPVGRYYVTPIYPRYTFSHSPAQVLVRSGRAVHVNFRGAPLVSADTYVTYLAGLWNVTFSDVKTNCVFKLPALTSATAISQQLNSASVTLPSLGTFRLPVSGNGFGGSVKFRKSLCTATGSVTSTFPTQDSGTLSSSLDFSCLLSNPCQISFKGTFARQ